MTVVAIFLKIVEAGVIGRPNIVRVLKKIVVDVHTIVQNVN